jgi:type I restriction enzyme, R subunit
MDSKAEASTIFSDDPIVALIIVRQFGKVLAQFVAAASGLFTDATEQQHDLLRRLRVDGNYPRSVLDLFHQLRIAGVRRQNISDIRFGKLREYLAHLV